MPRRLAVLAAKGAIVGALVLTAGAGLGVLTVWAAGALLAGGFLLRLRDA
jgi:hypothetical protein